MNTWRIPSRSAWMTLAVVVCVAGVLLPALAQRSGGKRRGKDPPRKWPSTVLNAFFPDVRKAVGPGRPGTVPMPAASAGSGSPGSSNTGNGGSVASGKGWAELISPEVLEDEIKRSITPLAEAVSTPSKFKSGRHRVARRLFSVDAVLLNIVAQFPGDVRFKRVAPALRQQLARSGFNCKVNSDSAFQGAKRALELLQGAVRGEKIDAPEGAETVVPFPKAADRQPLMQRMEQAQQGRLSPWLASQGDFKANAEQILHEAQVLAALARVIQDPEYEYGEDDTYLEYAQAMEKGARDLVQAVKLQNYEQARKALAVVTQSCSDCHGDYRN